MPTLAKTANQAERLAYYQHRHEPSPATNSKQSV
jgi:hypothetical protein